MIDDFNHFEKLTLIKQIGLRMIDDFNHFAKCLFFPIFRPFFPFQPTQIISQNV